jgi:hypothetical protein
MKLIQLKTFRKIIVVYSEIELKLTLLERYSVLFNLTHVACKITTAH